jgi:predicted anti-sigma-YlaC factor YlaD
MSADCDNLEDYLAADLSTGDAARFAEHLKCCDDCRDAVEQQRWIDGLLRDSANDDAELPPDDVLVTLRAAIDRERGRTRQFAFALAAAAILLVAVGWIALSRRAANFADDVNVRPAVAMNQLPNAAQAPRAAFVSDSNAIAVPVKSRNSDVTIVRVYPTYQPRYDNQTAAIQPEAPTKQDWNINSIGG